MDSIAIITARGGSKRIPRKNIKEFCGKPIIAYSIEAALESGLFNEVMVSTDDGEIADISLAFGASVPFMRSKANSDDYADTADVVIEVLDRYGELGGTYPEFCCIYPTAPFVTAGKLKESHSLLKNENAHSVIPVVRFSFPPQRGFVARDGFIKPVDDAAFEMRSQDLAPVYHDCGQFYWCKTNAFRECRSLVTRNTVPYMVPEIEVQDIDNEDDWKLAELKFERMRRSLDRKF